MSSTPVSSEHVVPLGEATRAWFRISLQTFGGPAGQIAVMQRELVDERRWIGERRFLHALSYCMLLPGPEAQQLAIYTGWLLNGWLGGLVAGVLFVLPGLVALLGLSWLYVAQGDTTLVAGLFLGLGPAVLAIVVQALVRIAGRALTDRGLVAIAVTSFASLALLGVPFPVVVVAAGLLGFLLGRWRPRAMVAEEHGGAAGAATPLVPDEALHRAAPSWRRNVLVLVPGVVLWLAPVAAFAVLSGGDSVYVDQGVFFAGTALVTFGGAYAVLSYVADQAVNTYGWLDGGEMVRGLGLAETTPGPLIMVVVFVAFLGGYRDPGTLDPVVAGMLAGLLTTWVTFVPCFLFIFLGAPYVERLRGNRTLSSALTGITAAVVGVIANLGLFFAVNVLFSQTRELSWGPFLLLAPVWSAYVWEAVAIGAVSFVLVFVLKWPVLRVIGACALLGLLTTVAP